jgi:hypothetical protein
MVKSDLNVAIIGTTKQINSINSFEFSTNLLKTSMNVYWSRFFRTKSGD